MKKTDLANKVGISSATLAKLSKGKPISGANIEKLCIYFRCQVQDVVEIIWDTVPAKVSRKKGTRNSAPVPAVTKRRSVAGRKKS